MSTPETPAPPAATMVGKQTALVLCVLLLGGMAAVLAFTAADNARRRSSETVTEPRAVGDERFFALQQKLVADESLASFGGRTLFPAKLTLEEHRDSQMEKAGLDDTGTFHIYRKLDPEEAAFYFLKVGNGSYVKATAKR